MPTVAELSTLASITGYDWFVAKQSAGEVALTGKAAVPVLREALVPDGTYLTPAELESGSYPAALTTVGIGATSPSVPLTVTGKALFLSGSQWDWGIKVQGGRIFVGGDPTGVDVGIFGKDSGGNLFMDANMVGADIGFYTNAGDGNYPKLFLKADGRLGVGTGTAEPASTLTVVGDIEASGTGHGVILASPSGTRWRLAVSKRRGAFGHGRLNQRSGRCRIPIPSRSTPPT